MFSIICACNDDNIYNKMLLPSLQKQSYKDYEVIKLDAKSLGFIGAAQTLNYGASIAKGDVLVFVHQDIEFIDEDFLDKLNGYCTEYDFGIVGVAGVIGDEVYATVVQTRERSPAGIIFEQVKEASSLDECLLIIKKESFKGFTDYNSWHFYGVEYSLRCIRSHKKVLLFPLLTYHLSPGWSLNNSYWDTLKKVAKDFKDFKVIPTTMGCYRNNLFMSVYIIYRKLKTYIKSCLS